MNTILAFNFVLTLVAMNKNLRFFQLLFFFVASAAMARQSDGERSIREELWFFNTETSRFEPSFKATTPDKRLVGFYIGLSGDDLHMLKICAPVGTAIWVDMQLVIGKTAEPCFNVDLADWRSTFAKDSVFVLMRKDTDLIATTSVSTLASGSIDALADQRLVPRSRFTDRKDQFILLFTIAFFGITGFFRLQFPRIFRSVVDLNKILSLRVRDEMVSGFRLFSMPSVTIHILVSILGGFFLAIDRASGSESAFSANMSLWDYMGDWAVFSLLLLGFLLAKRFITQIFGEIFQMRSAIYLQVFEFLRSIFILLTVALLMYVAFFYISVGVADWFIRHMPAFTIAFVFFALLLMFYKLAFETRYQKLHLFSYLCATEILPALILLKWMFF